MRLHEWAFPLTVWRAMHGLLGGAVNASTAVVEESLANIAATVMGRHMFGGHPGPWDATKPWIGWWGVNPPFHHPVFVLTHHACEPLEHRAAGLEQVRHEFYARGRHESLNELNRDEVTRDLISWLNSVVTHGATPPLPRVRAR
jgi:hypothetical protein